MASILGSKVMEGRGRPLAGWLHLVAVKDEIVARSTGDHPVEGDVGEFLAGVVATDSGAPRVSLQKSKKLLIRRTGYAPRLNPNWKMGFCSVFHSSMGSCGAFLHRTDAGTRSGSVGKIESTNEWSPPSW